MKVSFNLNDFSDLRKMSNFNDKCHLFGKLCDNVKLKFCIVEYTLRKFC